ncbi:death domain-associated protein 6-like [Planococcus citri]|uniref:death domain-associated protein 6-like n=1 Tax=Planococcus citri TaxID=170843 RepID=UPI0031F83EEA
MSVNLDEITVLSSGTEDEVPSGYNGVKSNCSDDVSATTNKRRVALQRVVTGKEMFSEFLEKCKSKEKSVEMEKIIKKLWKRFDEATEKYTKSSSFKELVLKCTNEIDSKLYSSMKMICDELQSNKKTQTNSTSSDPLPSTSASTSSSSNQEGLDPKTAWHIEKLEKLLTKLQRRIHKLENVEVDLNSSDEENSAYIQVASYKRRFCQVFKKLCEMKKKDPHAERTLWKNIKFKGTNIPEVDRAIEKFYNDRREFPDYRDILSVVKKANEIKKLNLMPAEINNYALKAFQELGKTLQKYRLLDDVEIFRSYLPADEDPASNNPELENTLKENYKKFGGRIDEVIDKYAVMQEEARLEPAEVDSDVKDEEDSDGEQDSVSDCESRSSILESKSDSEDSADLDEEHPAYPACSIVLTDVRLTPDWQKYVVPEQGVQSKKSDSDVDKYPTVVIEMCSIPGGSRKRSHDQSDSDENPTTEASEPTPSTSRDFVPITLDEYRHNKRSKIEKRDESTRRDASKTSVFVTIEKISTKDDGDVMESCDKNIKKRNNDATRVQKTGRNLNESTISHRSKNVVSSNNKEFPVSNNNNVRNTENSDDELVETSSNNNKDSGTTNKSPVSSESEETVDDDDDHENSKRSPFASHSVSKVVNHAKSNSSTINDIIDINMDGSQKKISKNTKKNTLRDNKRREIPNDLVQAGNHFMCNGASMPVEVVMDVDSSNESESSVKNNPSVTAKNIDSDDVMVIDEIVKPKTPVKGNNEIIDVEEISDSPEKPKQNAPKKLATAVNLTKMIRGMKFKPETIPTNRTPTASSLKQSTLPRSTGIPLRSNAVVRNNHPNFRQMMPSQNSVSVAPRVINGFANNIMRAPINNQRPTNARQYASMHSQNVQYFPNNANVTVKSSQAAMQRKVTSRTVRTFDTRTNQMVTKQVQVTTVVQQSVMQVVGQNRTVFNNQVRQTNTRRISSNRNNCSDDIITLD